jgi:hypothetical protein
MRRKEVADKSLGVKFWMLYMKPPKHKKFYPVNWKSGKIVFHRIHATMFTDEEKNIVQESLELHQDGLFEFKWMVIERKEKDDS